jgi:hypothetical protein
MALMGFGMVLRGRGRRVKWIFWLVKRVAVTCQKLTSFSHTHTHTHTHTHMQVT